MSSETISGELKRLEESRTTLEAELDVKMDQVAKDLVGLVGTWMRQRAKRQLDANSDKIESIGAAGVAKLKQGVEGILPTLPEVCRAALGPSSQWPHRNLGRHPRRDEDSFWDQVFRKCVEPLGPLLEECGILYEPGADFRGWDRVLADGRDFHRYNGRNPFNEISVASHREYEQLMQLYKNIVRSIKAKSKDTGKART